MLDDRFDDAMRGERGGERGDVDAPAVRDAGQRLRAITFRREEIEPARLRPIVNERVQSGVAGVPGGDAFGGNVVELRL